MNRLAWRWEILNTGIPHFRTVWRQRYRLISTKQDAWLLRPQTFQTGHSILLSFLVVCNPMNAGTHQARDRNPFPPAHTPAAAAS